MHGSCCYCGLDLRLNIPATNDDNDDGRWSNTETVGVRATRETATQTEMEEVPVKPEFHFHLPELFFSLQQKMPRAIEHLIRGEEVIFGDQQSQSRTRVTYKRCGQENTTVEVTQNKRILQRWTSEKLEKI